MSSEILKRDQNHVTVMAGVSNDTDQDIIMLRVDPTTKELLVGSTSGIPVSGNSIFESGSKSVTTAGLSEQLSVASVSCRKLTVQANVGNMGTIYVGGSSVSSTSGYNLLPLQSIVLTINNLNLVYLDSSESGDGIQYIYEN